jgi:hypothetical protein
MIIPRAFSPAMIFAIAMSAANHASAQGAGCNPTTLFKSLNPTTFSSAVQNCAASDVQAVIADAQTAPIDYVALACMQPLAGIVQAKQQGGLLLAWQKFRRAKQAGIISACAAWIAP